MTGLRDVEHLFNSGGPHPAACVLPAFGSCAFESSPRIMENANGVRSKKRDIEFDIYTYVQRLGSLVLLLK